MLRHRVGQELHDRQCRHRLAGAALADQRHGFALGDIEAHVLHRVDGAARYAEADAKIAHLQQGLHQSSPPAAGAGSGARSVAAVRSEEHTSELQSLMRISYAVFCLKKKKKTQVNDSDATY